MIGIAVSVVTVAAFILSSVYYVLLTPWEQRATAGRAIERGAPGPRRVIAELLRTAVLAGGFAGVAVLAGMTDLPRSLLLAVVLWVVFPAVLLSGSVIWDRVPVPTALLHAGDWLMKLVLIALIIGLLP